MNITDYIPAFRKVLQIHNYSSHTVDAYVSWLKKFIDYSYKFPIEPEKRIGNFLTQVQSGNKNPEVAYSAISTFYRLVLEKPCPHTRDFSRLSIPFETHLSVQDVITLVESIGNLQHRLMFALMYSSGLRGSEVLALRIEDVCPDSLKIFVRKAGTQSERVTIVSQRLIPALRELAGDRPAHELLFLNRDGKPYSIRSLQLLFKRALAKSGLSKEATCHSLRHCFAMELLKNGVHIKIIQSLLGHKHSKSTKGYLKIVEIQNMHIPSPY